jgi:hypothetical protein
MGISAKDMLISQSQPVRRIGARRVCATRGPMTGSGVIRHCQCIGGSRCADPPYGLFMPRNWIMMRGALP